MDQNPLPRGSFQIHDRSGEELRALPELPEAAVAVEAQYPAHPTGAMIVIKVFGVGSATDGAPTLLCRQQLVEGDLPDAVPPPEVRLPRPTVRPVPRLLAPGMVTRLAVGRVTGAGAVVAREVGQGLGRSTIRTISMPVRDLPDGPHIAIVGLADPLDGAGPGSRVEAVLAVAPAPAGAFAARQELLHRFPLAAVTTTSFTITVVQPPWHVRSAP